jgi:hypothetical protein
MRGKSTANGESLATPTWSWTDAQPARPKVRNMTTASAAASA